MENGKNLNSLLKSAVKAMVDKDSEEWPPGCSMLVYQPVHPRAKAEMDRQEAPKE